MDDTQIIKEQFDAAPATIKTLITREAWKGAVEMVAKGNHLSAEQMTELQNEVLFVLLGMDLRTSFAQNVQENVGVSSLVAGGIALDIDKEIFMPIRDLLPTEVENEPTPGRFTTTQTGLRSGEVTKPKTLSEEILAASQFTPEPPKSVLDVEGPKTQFVVDAPVKVAMPEPKADLLMPELTTPHDEIAKPEVIAAPAPIVAAEVTPPPVAPQIIPPTIPQNTALEQKVAENLIPDVNGNRIIVDQYKGNDPYREPL